jgi:hypothetical protein
MTVFRIVRRLILLSTSFQAPYRSTTPRLLSAILPLESSSSVVMVQFLGSMSSRIACTAWSPSSLPLHLKVRKRHLGEVIKEPMGPRDKGVNRQAETCNSRSVGELSVDRNASINWSEKPELVDRERMDSRDWLTDSANARESSTSGSNRFYIGFHIRVGISTTNGDKRIGETVT